MTSEYKGITNDQAAFAALGDWACAAERLAARFGAAAAFFPQGARFAFQQSAQGFHGASSFVLARTPGVHKRYNRGAFIKR